MTLYQVVKPAANIVTSSALQMTSNKTESGSAKATSADTMTTELKLQDKHISGSKVRSDSGIESSSLTPGEPFQPVSQTAAAAATAVGEQFRNRTLRATSPTGNTSNEGPPNTPHNENEADDAYNDAAEHATRLQALLSALPNLEVAGQCPPDEDSERGDALSDTEHSTNPVSPTTPPFEYAAITADENSQNAVFSQGISMDDMDGWEVVRTDS